MFYVSLVPSPIAGMNLLFIGNGGWKTLAVCSSPRLRVLNTTVTNDARVEVVRHCVCLALLFQPHTRGGIDVTIGDREWGSLSKEEITAAYINTVIAAAVLKSWLQYPCV